MSSRSRKVGCQYGDAEATLSNPWAALIGLAKFYRLGAELYVWRAGQEEKRDSARATRLWRLSY